ncbi:MAG TPA: hypothetical protein VHV51_05775 [Polyangiaceae bacterium]|nr:hypothetical protein [Polyangiaceae bacterium]
MAAACSTTDAGDDSSAGAGGSATSSAGSGTTTGGSGTTAAGNSSVAGSGTSTAGTTGSAGSGTAGTGPLPTGVMCPPVGSATLSNFDPVDGSTSSGTWGDFTDQFSGGEFIYPSGTQMYPLTSDTSMGNFHVTGTVGTYSGIGLFWGPNLMTCATAATDAGACPACNEVDLSAYDGITFSIKGSAPAMTAANVITFSVDIAPDDVSDAFANAHKSDPMAADQGPSFASCTPSSAMPNANDGTCAAPSFKVTITDTAQTVNVKWSDFTGGKPQAGVDPKQISGIRWILPTPAGVGTALLATYDLDLTIDDFGLIPHAAN